MDEYTVVLLHFNDGLKDENGKVWTAVNGAAVSTAASKFGAGSLYLSGMGQSINTPNSTDFAFGSADFTIDFWLNWSGQCPGSKGHSTLFGQNPGSSATARVNLFPDGSLVMYINDDTVRYQSPTQTIQPNVWTHVAMVRSGTSFYLFVNGEKLGIVNYTAAIQAINHTFEIGDEDNGGCTYKGYIDEFRISKGIARWTDGGFDPGQEPPQSGGKSLLRIAMLGDEHKEYELTKAQLDAFVNWYTARSAGTGDAYYTFNKDFNLGPFASRVDYLPFEKISAFEVLTIPE